MQPAGMTRRAAGLAPFVEHRRGDRGQFGILIGRADIAGQFQPMAVGIEEIDRPENAVLGRPQHLHALRLKMRLGSQ